MTTGLVTGRRPRTLHRSLPSIRSGVERLPLPGFPLDGFSFE
jgi:hypothetical protein